MDGPFLDEGLITHLIFKTCCLRAIDVIEQNRSVTCCMRYLSGKKKKKSYEI